MKTTPESILPKSIQERAIQNCLNGMQPIEALKKAFEQEEEMVFSLLNGSGGLSPKGKLVAEIICKDVYERLSLTK